MNIEIKTEDFVGEMHKCESRRDGDWLIFTCSKCKDYERRMNIRTNEMRVKGGDNYEIRHNGSFVPIGLENFSSTPN